MSPCAPYADAEVAGLAQEATVSQLTRVLRRYAWAPEANGSEDREADEADGEEAEPRRVDFGTTEEGAWRLSALLPIDEGAVVERALEAARHELGDNGERPSWADALVAVADRSLGGTSRPQRDRHLVLVHLRGEEHGPSANLHLGPPLPDALRRHIACDGRNARGDGGGRGGGERGPVPAHRARAHPPGRRGPRRVLSGAGL